MEILLITPEIAPYSRSGELGDVCAALPKALRGLGHKVTVISPLWAGIDPTARGLARRLSSVEVNLGAQRYACTLHDGRTTGGVELVFVGHAEAFARRAGRRQPRGADCARRWCSRVRRRKSRPRASPRPRCVHAHGWFAAGALALAQDELPDGRARALAARRAQQGALRDLPDGQVVPPSLASSVGASASLLAGRRGTRPQRVVASSHDEAERLRAERRRRSRARCSADSKLLGIANGLDAARWNPLTDPLLPARFDPVDLSGKARCKDALQLELGLPIRPDVPLLACVGSSAADGGATLAAADRRAPAAQRRAARRAGRRRRGARALLEPLLGSRFEERLRAACRMPTSACAPPDRRRRSRARARRTTRATAICTCARSATARCRSCARSAAMADAVVDCDAELVTGNGFVFESADAEELLAATPARARRVRAAARAFDALRQRVMKLDVSWERSARRYEYVYREAPHRRRQELSQCA